MTLQRRSLLLCRRSRTRPAGASSSLNHRAGIYGTEASDDTLEALVLELVVADRIAKGPIPLDELPPIAKQTAETLEFAHEGRSVRNQLQSERMDSPISPHGSRGRATAANREAAYAPPPEHGILITSIASLLADTRRELRGTRQARLFFDKHGRVEQLWCAGDTTLVQKLYVAVVGTRQPTNFGAAWARRPRVGHAARAGLLGSLRRHRRLHP